MVRIMTDAHKEANEVARAENRAVKAYLTYLDEMTAKQRRADPDVLQKRIIEIAERIKDATPFQRIHLIQDRRNLEEDLRAHEQGGAADAAALEDAFVAIAAVFSSRKGIDYASWREFGVPVATLERAGITRKR